VWPLFPWVEGDDADADADEDGEDADEAEP